jgi:hypothetical protein
MENIQQNLNFHDNNIEITKLDKFNLEDIVKNVVELLYLNHNKNVETETLNKEVSKILPSLTKKYQIVTKRRIRRIIPPEVLCMGRKLDGKQCTRHRQDELDFCKSHARKLPNGRINENVPQPREKARRGRKPKIVFDARHNDNNYVETCETIITGQKYLLDADGNVFTFDLENPSYIGKKTCDGKLELLNNKIKT